MKWTCTEQKRHTELGGSDYLIRGEDGMVLAVLYHHADAARNARLAAAAPDLLSLAERLLAWDAAGDGNSYKLFTICDSARSAVAKIKGG